MFKLGPFVRGAIPPEFDIIWKRSATIVLGARPVRPALSAVMNDQFSTVGQAVEEVTRLGYERVGLCVSAQIEDIVEHRFLGGFLAARNRLQCAYKIPPYAALDKRAPPDVILTLHPRTREWLEAMKIKAPDDIGLVHLDLHAELKGWAGMRQTTTRSKSPRSTCSSVNCTATNSGRRRSRNACSSRGPGSTEGPSDRSAVKHGLPERNVRPRLNSGSTQRP